MDTHHTIDARTREHILYGYRGASRGYDANNDVISEPSVKIVALYAEVGVDTAVFLDTTDGCACVTCEVSDVNGYHGVLTTLHVAKHVLVPHGLPCDVVGLVLLPGDRKSH